MRGMTVPSTNTGAAATLQKGILSSLSIGWRALTQAQMIGWNNFFYTKSDVWGQPYDVSGKAAYIALNQNQQNTGGSAIVSAPTKLGSINVTISNLVADTTGGTLEVNSTVFLAGHRYMTFATPAMSPGIFKPGRSPFTLLGNLPALVAGVADITAIYVAKYGALPPVGSKVFVYVVGINNATGEASAKSSILSAVAI